MSRLNPNSKPFVPGGKPPTPKLAPKPVPKPKIPQAPKMPGPSPTQKANLTLNAHENVGGHSRSKHVGKSDAFLKGRNIPTATGFKTAHDQNKVAGKALGGPHANTASNKAITTGKHQSIKVQGGLGRTAPIARVAQGGQTFNAKVTETTMVMKGGTGKVLTTYPSKFTALPKPASGPNLKPTSKVNVKDIATGAANLRKVGAPVARSGMPVGKVVPNPIKK